MRGRRVGRGREGWEPAAAAEAKKIGDRSCAESGVGYEAWKKRLVCFKVRAMLSHVREKRASYHAAKRKASTSVRPRPAPWRPRPPNGGQPYLPAA